MSFWEREKREYEEKDEGKEREREADVACATVARLFIAACCVARNLAMRTCIS